MDFDLSLCDPRVIPFGFAVSFLVSFLRRFPVLSKYPKIVSLVLSFSIAWLTEVTSPGHAIPLSQIVQCAILIFGTSVVTYEVATKPVTAAIKTRRETPEK